MFMRGAARRGICMFEARPAGYLYVYVYLGGIQPADSWLRRLCCFLFSLVGGAVQIDRVFFRGRTYPYNIQGKCPVGLPAALLCFEFCGGLEVRP